MRACQKCLSGQIDFFSAKTYKTYKIPIELKCDKCAFRKENNKIHSFKLSIDKIHQLLGKTYESWDYKDKEEANKNDAIEILSANIMKKIYPNGDVIIADMGLINSQYDLLIINENSTIAVEVSQATNQIEKANESYETKKGNFFPSNQLRYEWYLTRGNNFSILKHKNKIEKFLLKLEQYIEDDQPQIKFERD